MSKFIFALSQASGPTSAPPISALQPARLSEVTRDQVVEVVGLDERCEGFGRRRLLDLGFTRGTAVVPALDTFAGDPRGYLIRGTLIALRRDQAALILVQPRQEPDPASSPERPR